MFKELYNNSVPTNETLLELLSWTLSFNAIGYFLSLVCAITLAIASVATKELTILKTHFSIIGLYTSFIGLPLSFSLVIVSNIAGYEIKEFSLFYQLSFLYDVAFVLISAGTSNLKKYFDRLKKILIIVSLF